jgi:hypothetical protein
VCSASFLPRLKAEDTTAHSLETLSNISDIFETALITKFRFMRVSLVGLGVRLKAEWVVVKFFKSQNYVSSEG